MTFFGQIEQKDLRLFTDVVYCRLQHAIVVYHFDGFHWNLPSNDVLFYQSCLRVRVKVKLIRVDF